MFKTLEIIQEAKISSDAESKPSWRWASKEEKQLFQDILEEKLSSIQCPDSVSQCKDTKCQDETHCAELDFFGAEMLGAVQEVAKSCLPVPRGEQEKEKDGHKKSLVCWD